MAIELFNLSDGALVRSSIIFVSGKLTSHTRGCDTVLVWTDESDAATAWPVVNGLFKAFLRLSVGPNRLSVRYGYITKEIGVTYVAYHPSYIVRPVYVVCRGHDGRFQGPAGEDCSKESAQKRLALAAELLQCFTAENLYEHGLGRHTFELERDAGGHALCTVFESELTLDEAHAMKEEDYWKYFAKELMNSPFKLKHRCKFLAFMSFTRYQFDGVRLPERHAEVIAFTKGHAALGGGGLALCGTGTLHTWPETLEDLVSRFTDSRKIDLKQLMDDSCYRRTHWANYSTSLGAAMHELGHAFGLAHTEDGIMGRGFNDMHRFFVLPNSRPVEQPPADFLNRLRDIKQKVSAARSSAPVKTRQPDVRILERSFRKEASSTKCPTSLQTKSDFTLSSEDRGKTRDIHLDEMDPPTSAECSVLSTQQPPGGLPSTADLNLGSCELPAELSCRWNQDGGAHWSRSSAVALRYCKWFTPSACGESRDVCGPPYFSESKRALVAPAGLRLVEVMCGGARRRVLARWEYVQEQHAQLPTEHRMGSCLGSVLRQHQCASCWAVHASTLTILAVDDAGRTHSCDVPRDWLL